MKGTKGRVWQEQRKSMAGRMEEYDRKNEKNMTKQEEREYGEEKGI